MTQDEKVKKFISFNDRSLSILVFSLYFSWLLAFPFEGQILYAFSNKYGLNISSMVIGAITAHFLGLIIAGIFIKNINAAKKLLLLAIVFVIICNNVFFFPPTVFWHLSLIITAFLAGASVAAWGFFFKKYTPSPKRLRTAAEGLIYSNILMIFLNMTAIHITPEAGLFFAQIFLGGALFFAFKLPVNERVEQKTHLKLIKSANSVKPFVFLCLFIFIITINSGLMYQVFNPAFAHLESIVSWYWAAPYIIALYIIKSLPEKINRTYLLYVAIAMMGLSFVFFMIFDHSVSSYFLVNTLMLGACGVYDIFWWSILGAMLDYYENPAYVLGWGLSANVLGVLAGGTLGNAIISMESPKYNPSLFALIIVFTILIILPLLHKHLSLLLKNHAFLSPLFQMPSVEEKAPVKPMHNIMINNHLTEREMEIASLLLKGRTYKMIAGELNLSENTIKTHIKNIYGKLNIQSKTELVNLLGKNENTGLGS